jgi:hypothetical protein
MISKGETENGHPRKGFVFLFGFMCHADEEGLQSVVCHNNHCLCLDGVFYV